MRILFLSRWFPYPPNNGSKIRIFNILRQLSQQHDVVLLTFAEESDRVDADSLGVLREYCSNIQVLPYRPFRPSSSRAALGLFSSMPRSLVDTRNDAMIAAVSAQIARDSCDLVVVSQLDMVPYAPESLGVPSILEELELTAIRDHIQRVELPHRRARAALTWLKLAGYVRRVLPGFAACTVVCERERQCLQMVTPNYKMVKVIPNAVDLASYEGDFGPAIPNTIVYSGALTYGPNYDAINYFLSHVYPAIQPLVSDLVLQITGGTEGVDLSSISRHPGVQFTGYVDDVRPIVARSWMSVVPLRMGGGTRVKILESMALGTPVVSTSRGAIGLDVVDREDILLADDPEQFAGSVVDLLRSTTLRARIARNGRRLVETKYDWGIVGRELNELVEQVGSGRRPNPGHPVVSGVSVG